MNCQRVEELLSDHLEGALNAILRTEVETHLASCAACSELRLALQEVVEALQAYPALEPPRALAERAARAALVRPREVVVRPAFLVPSWVQAAAAGFALIALGTLLIVLGPEAPTRAAQRLVGETVTAGNHLLERKDRLFEDVRILGVVLSTAFEGRLDRVNERVEDYRRLLERRRASPAEGESKRGSEADPFPSGIASALRTASRWST